jgi:hypothetical protein
MPPIRPEEPSEPLDEKLYRMMLVPLGLNEIREALQKDKTALSRKCKKIREDRGMGGWPKPSQKPKMTQEQRIERMMRVPMGFNEIARVERINRNNLSKMCKDIAARAGISFEEEADEDRGDKE